MYIAMNRFKVVPGGEEAFENAWRGRAGRLGEMQGFREFNLLRGPRADDHTLYASHTVWASEDDFVEWTKSEQFRDAHRNAGERNGLYLGHPQFEGFSVLEDI